MSFRFRFVPNDSVYCAILTYRKQCWHLVSEWTYDLMNALKYHWLIFISSCYEACGVQRFHLQEVCARDRFCILPRTKKPMALFHIKFFCHVTLATLKENFNMWVPSGSYLGHIQIVLWVNGSNESTGATHFQP